MAVCRRCGRGPREGALLVPLLAVLPPTSVHPFEPHQFEYVCLADFAEDVAREAKWQEEQKHGNA